MTSLEGVAIHEYGIDPGIVDSWERFSRFFIECCGYGEGRVISAIPNRRRWSEAVIEACRNRGMSPVRLQSVMERLRRGEDRFFERGASPPGHDLEWLSAAIAEHEREELRLIIARSTRSYAFVETPEDLDADGRWKATKSGPLERSVEAIKGLCAKLLAQSRRLSIVDPYLDVKGRVFRTLLPHAWKGRAPSRVDLHVTSRSGPNEFIDESIQELIPAGGSVTVHVWERESMDESLDKVHDRFLLTELGGLSLGWGFQDAQGSATQASLMDQESCRAWLARLRPDAGVYRLERDPFVVWGIGT